MNSLDDYDYDLPAELIAQHPLAERDAARLLVVDRASGELQHRRIRDLPDILGPGDCLVVNNTRVVPARVFGYRTATAGRWEGLFLETLESGEWRLMSQTRGKLVAGESVTLVAQPDSGGGQEYRLELVEREPDGIWRARPQTSEPALEILNRFGAVPLPPYIERQQPHEEDRERYQTVFSQTPGAVAAPTAGLHFTPELLSRCEQAGISRTAVTLHVGIGTFRPLSEESFETGRLHTEYCEVSEATAAHLNGVRNARGRVVAVGTTSARTLESTVNDGAFHPAAKRTDLFIRPPYQFQGIDGLLTNFHLPRSSLLVLIAAFLGLDLTRHVYQTAIEMRYSTMTRQNRREFLEQSMFAAATAVTAGGIVGGPDSLYSQEKKSNEANERLRVAVVGVRGRGQSHLSAFMARPDTEVVAIVDADEAIGQKKGVERVKKTTGKTPKFYSDIRKMLDDKSINLVTIATPNHWHALGAIWAIQHGKDVYCEKPVSHNVSEGRRIVQAARKHKKIVQTGTQCRSMGGTIKAIEFVKAGKIGEVNLARGLCYKPRGSIGPRGTYEPPKSVDFNMWLGPAPMAKLTRPKLHYDWHWQWAYGNGDLGNQGIHQMDICRWGLGVSGLGDRVVSYGGRLGYVDAGETANTQVSVHDYRNKRLVFEVRGLNTKALLGAKVGVIFYGSKGYVVLTSYTGGAAFDPDGKIIEKFAGDGDHFGNFVDAVRSRKHTDLHADIEEGHFSSALCHLGNVSYRMGSEVSFEEAADRLGKDEESQKTYGRVTDHLRENNVDPAKSKIQFGQLLTLDGSKEIVTGALASKANPWLSREYRKGFAVPGANEV
eukprot:g21431.t1